MDNVILEMLKYFAKFPAKERVLKEFTGSDDLTYTQVHDFINNLDPHSLIPQLQVFIFDTNTDFINNRIKESSEWYLLVDYGELIEEKNQNNAITYHIPVSITVGKLASGKNTDQIERAILSQEGLTIIRNILNQIEADNKEICSNNRLEQSGNIIPIEGAMLYNTVGWIANLKQNVMP